MTQCLPATNVTSGGYQTQSNGKRMAAAVIAAEKVVNGYSVYFLVTF